MDLTIQTGAGALLFSHLAPALFNPFLKCISGPFLNADAVPFLERLSKHWGCKWDTNKMPVGSSDLDRKNSTSTLLGYFFSEGMMWSNSVPKKKKDLNRHTVKENFWGKKTLIWAFFILKKSL